MLIKINSKVYLANMEEESLVKNPEHVTEILQAMREEFFSLMGLDKATENDYSFAVHMLPAHLPGSGSYEVINNFKLILDGACAQPSLGKDTDTRVSVKELVVDGGSIKGHSYIITPLKFKGIMSSMGDWYYSYVFFRPATSGYDGTGPDIQRSIQAFIDGKIPIVKQKVVKVKSSDSLEGLFYERGPIVDIFSPRFEVAIGYQGYDKRFME